jgi:hypothetical protein
MRSESSRAAWIEGGVLAAVVLAILVLGGEAVRASYHGYLHAALGEAVIRGGLLPENPYHAGEALRYYTLYPLLGAAIGRIGIGPLWAFAAIDALAALLLAPAFDALGRSLGLAPAARRAAFLAAVLGFNGLGWLGFLASRGPGAGVPPVYALLPMTFGSQAFGWDGRLQAFLPKFLNVSSYAIALPFALWALAPCARAPGAGGRPRGELVQVSVSLALSVALNPLVGGFVGLCAALWIAPEALRGGVRAGTFWALAFLAAGALALPFLLPAFRPTPHGAELTGKVALGGNPWSNLAGPNLLLLPLGILGWRGLAPAARPRFLAAAAIAAALVLLGEMPQGNEYKMSRLTGLLWAIPAGAWAARARRTSAAIALLCLPTTLAVPWAYVAWGSHAAELPLRVRAGRLAPRDARLAPLMEAESRADERAVVLISPDFPGAQGAAGLVQGNALAPALRHPLFVDLPQIHNDGVPDLEERLELLDACYGGEDGEAIAAALARIRGTVAGRPLIAFTDGPAQEPAASLAKAGASLLARAGDCALWSLPAVAR